MLKYSPYSIHVVIVVKLRFPKKKKKKELAEV